MKFKKGDKVKVIADDIRLRSIGVYDSVSGETGTVVDIFPEDKLPVCAKIGETRWVFDGGDLKLVEKNGVSQPLASPNMVRTFATGATRDTVEGKLSYVKALSPIVLRRYVQYLDVNRLKSDGNIREFDNWKKGIDVNTYLDSLGRHFIDAWLLHDGYDAADNHGPVDLETVLCAIIFNSMGMLHEVLTEGADNNE